MAFTDSQLESSTEAVLVQHGKDRSASLSSGSTVLDKTETSKVERTNLLNIAKICIKTLIDGSLRCGRTLTESFPPLNQFFIILEHVLRHGLKAKRSILSQRREFWGVFEAVDSKIPSLSDMIVSIKNLPNIKSNTGKGRAWIRLAMMQKVLAEQIRCLVEEQQKILRDWYEDSAMLLCEEGFVFSGLLVGLNVIDCNFDLKGEDLDGQIGIIDISMYLKDGNYLERSSKEGVPVSNQEEHNGLKLEMVLDQKAYLEELNRSLSDTLSLSQSKASQFQEQNVNLKNELDILRRQLAEVTTERDQLREENLVLLEDNSKKMELAQADIDIERETYQVSRAGLNELYLESRRELEQEARQKRELQKELTVQIAMNKEKEVAMQLLEKDIHEKQDSLIALRQQTDEIKRINLELHDKWQSSESQLKAKEDGWNVMEQKCGRLMNHTKELEKQLAQAEVEKKSAIDAASQLGNRISTIDSERHALETNIKIEREWREGMQMELGQEKEKTKKLEKEAAQIKEILRENEEMKRKIRAAEDTSREQECALVEMGKQLSRTQQQLDEVKETSATMKDKVWTSDKDASQCQACEQPFSIARRKHHCRNCGGIFCNNCSDNSLPLPAAAKPVRVCDDCYAKLLERYTAAKKA